jgi:predicted nucleic acid-binding protein
MLDPAESDGLVLDTSVWINLLATDAIVPILKALVVPCQAPEQVIDEVNRHPLTGITFSGDNHPLRQMSPRVTVLALDGVELEIFLEIVGAPAGDALGDGEAAAIALAAARRLDLVIDDRKARRILRQRFSQVRVHWTVDLLQADSVAAALGRPLVDECFARALRFGRMHVPRT